MEYRTGTTLGAIGGTIRFLNIPNFIEAIITAFFCGLAGALASYLFKLVVRKLKQ